MRYYLDHAATSWPKPAGVVDAAVSYQQRWGSASGRGGYRAAAEADEILRVTRRLLAELIGAQSSEEIGFSSNATSALNAAIQGIAIHAAFQEKAPLHIITTATEHNSVLRPLELATQRGWLSWSIAPCNSIGLVSLDRVSELIRPDTKWLILNHASNVTGTLQPLERWSAFAKARGLYLMVDASQTLGYRPIDVQSLGIDVLAAPGHKGLGAMLGTGVLYVRREVEDLLSPLSIGGTGSESDNIQGPFHWREALESGNQNVPAIASLQAALEWKKKTSVNFQPWLEQLLQCIEGCESFRLVGLESPSSELRLPVLSLAPAESFQSLDTRQGICQEWAMTLESIGQVECRAGFHCAGAIHSFLGTEATGGTLRLSLGNTSTQADVDAACSGLELLNTLA